MSAVILPLPAAAQRIAQRRFNRVDIEGRHRWMRKNRDNWAVTELDGFEPEEYIKPRVRQLMEVLDKAWGDVSKPTIAEMKREIAQGRKIIAERNRIKAWLTARGVDPSTVNSNEDALSSMFQLVGGG
jgi:hypothetical protein